MCSGPLRAPTEHRSQRCFWQSNAIRSPHPIGSIGRGWVYQGRIENSEWGLPTITGKSIPGETFRSTTRPNFTGCGVDALFESQHAIREIHQ